MCSFFSYSIPPVKKKEEKISFYLLFSSAIREESIIKLPQSWSRCCLPDKLASSLPPVMRGQLRHLVVHDVII